MRIVQGVTFLDDGAVSVVFHDNETDIRNRDLLAMQYQLVVQPGEGGRDYLDEIEDVRDAVKRLVDEALADWSTPTDVGVPTPSSTPEPAPARAAAAEPAPRAVGKDYAYAQFGKQPPADDDGVKQQQPIRYVGDVGEAVV